MYVIKSFHLFMKQPGYQGREYDNGFIYNHFDDLTLEEKDVVTSLLRQGVKGDTLVI